MKDDEAAPQGRPANTNIDASECSRGFGARPPELHIVVPTEGKAFAFVTVTNSAEADDLRVWILNNEDDLRDQVSALFDQAEHIREAKA